MVDSFFTDPSKRKRKSKTTSVVRKRVRREESGADSAEDSADLQDSDGDIFDMSSEDEEVQDEEDSDVEEKVEEEEERQESAADKRRRLAKQYLEDLRGAGADGNGAFDAKDLDDEIISSRLKKDVAEEQGYVYKWIADKIKVQKARLNVLRVPEQGITSVCVRYPYMYTTSKEITLTKWDIRNGAKKPKKVRSTRGGSRFLELSKDNAFNGHCDEIYCSAVSPDGRYVVTGGKDRRIVVWSGENLICQRVLETGSRRGQVLGLAFRRNTDQLYVACADLKIRTYSVAQLAELETLYGHQDVVEDISALAQERCVTVGARDRTAMLWKIPDETRLTFRGGDSIEKYNQAKKKGQETFFVEGSLDCVSMVDDSHFVTGSDNGNVCLWSTGKKKPVFTVRQAHGMQPEENPRAASAEMDIYKAREQVPERQPYWITAVYAVPYSDVFVSGSWDGVIRVWRLSEDLREFSLLGELPRANGVVTRLDGCELGEEGKDQELRIYASVSKEPRLGRWVSKGRNAVYCATMKLSK